MHAPKGSLMHFPLIRLCRGQEGKKIVEFPILRSRANRSVLYLERTVSKRVELGTSWTSVIVGWFVALGVSLVLSAIVGAIVGAIYSVLGGSSATTGGGIAGLIGVLLTLLIAFFIGGYVAGRMASRQGVKHGLLVALMALVITIVLAIIGAAVGASFLDQLSGVTLPGPAGKAAQNVPQQDLGTILSVSGILALLFPFIGVAYRRVRAC
jgi:amino acid transporter